MQLGKRQQRGWTIATLVALAALVLFSVANCILPITEWAHPQSTSWMQPGFDFRLRLNEVTCLRDGVDPYDVWLGEVVKAPYSPIARPSPGGTEFCEPINAYTPWEYTLALPLSHLPRSVAWGVYMLVMVAALGVLFWGGYRIGLRVGCDRNDALIFAAVPLLLVVYPIWSNFNVGNYAVPILAAIFLMLWALERGHDILAGVCWAFAMIKPQHAVLLAVPLLMRGKFKTCFVAAGICLLATLPAVCLCGASPLKLILEVPSAGVDGFHGCATLPSYLCFADNPVLSLAVAATIGLLVCGWLTWRLRTASSWWLFALPAVICSISWSYTTSYTFVFAWLLVVCLLATGVKFGFRRIGWLLALAVLLVPRFYIGFRCAAVIFGVADIPLDVHYAIESTVSLAILLLTIIYVFLGTDPTKRTPA